MSSRERTRRLVLIMLAGEGRESSEGDERTPRAGAPVDREGPPAHLPRARRPAARPATPGPAEDRGEVDLVDAYTWS